MKLHHIGFIVKDIEIYERNMLFESKILEKIDPKQDALLSLYKNYSDTFIELVQPLNKNAFTWQSLKRNGNHFHHFCYEIDEDELFIIVQQQKLIYILGPIEALLFNNKMVVFYFNRNKQIIEFLLNSGEKNNDY